MTYKGIVKGNVVILGKNVALPDGLCVEIVVPQESTVNLKERQEAVARVEAVRKRISKEGLNLGELCIEGRRELEERA